MKKALNKKRIPISPRHEQVRYFVNIILGISLFIVSLLVLDLNLITFISRFERFPRVFKSFLGLEFDVIIPGLVQLFVSFAMAIGALFLSSILALIFSFLVAENTAPSKIIAGILKSFIAVIRAIPNLVLILMIVATMGLRPIAAVTSLTLSALGYLTRAFASTIEEQPKEIEETMKSLGASWFQKVIHGYFPMVYSSFISWISMRLEHSISDSITLGIIGVGGIGTMLSRAIRQHRFTEVTTLLLLVFFAVLLIELILNRYKRKQNIY